MPQNTDDLKKMMVDIEESIRSSLSGLPAPVRVFIEPIIKRNLKTLTGNLSIPKIALYGRSGAGKSSLINAILGKFVARVDPANPVIIEPEEYRYERNGWALDFVDTRGVGDSQDNNKAVRQAIDYVVEKKVDILLFVAPADERGWVTKDIEFLTELKLAHKREYKTDLTVILVINKIDRVAPSDVWQPPYELDFSEIPDKSPDRNRTKQVNILKCIRARVDEYKTVASKYVAICAYWDEYTNSNKLYNIGELAVLIHDNLPENARPGFAGATATLSVKKSVARTLSWTCALIAGSTCFIPVPGFGAISIIALQASLVSLIARMGRSNKDQQRVAKNFVENMGIFGAGMSIAVLVQEFTNFIPGIGIPITAAAAATVSAITMAVGEAASRHFIEGVSIEEARKTFKEHKDSSRQQFLEAFKKQRTPEEAAQKLEKFSKEYGIN